MEKVKQLTDSFANDEVITIDLEGCAQSFSVSRALLCRASDYFVKALDGGFMEATQRTLRLPGCDEQTFRLFLHFMVKNEIPRWQDMYDLDTDYDEKKPIAAFFQTALAKLWIFGDAYLIPKLQNIAMRTLLDVFRKYAVQVEAVQVAFAGTMDGPLQDVFVRETICDFDNGDGFDASEMDRFSAVPGFFHAFAMQCVECNKKECGHKIACAPSNCDDWGEFLVAEL